MLWLLCHAFYSIIDFLVSKGTSSSMCVFICSIGSSRAHHTHLSAVLFPHWSARCCICPLAIKPLLWRRIREISLLIWIRIAALVQASYHISAASCNLPFALIVSQSRARLRACWLRFAKFGDTFTSVLPPSRFIYIFIEFSHVIQ